ncbi:MAG: TIGR03862 family flavoprotein [Rhodobacteraceae bacterium]|nr:TIGR03862 family flavoprotein [Paracoccaceae bacterium]
MSTALVLGGGPAGLAAAEVLLARGHAVTLVDHKPSLARKFLMAGKSGLNITKDEPVGDLQRTIGCPQLDPMLAEFDAADVRAWADGLGQEVFTGSSGRVFPVAMKASPLLRAWLARLEPMDRRLGWRWVGFDGAGHDFDTPEGREHLGADVTVFAFGGASWARLGSDARWLPAFEEAGIPMVPFAPANMGLCVDWSRHMERYFGAPIKNVALNCAGRRVVGEFVLSRAGLEGSLIYALSPELRTGAPLFLDLKPGLSEAEVAARLAKRPAKESLSNRLRKALGIAGPLAALLQEFGRPLDDLPSKVKALPLHHTGARPLDEAISVAGGVAWGALDDGLMLRAKPGMYCAGEMLDWEAPTGGYLITASMATGRWAGRAAADFMER